MRLGPLLDLEPDPRGLCDQRVPTDISSLLVEANYTPTDLLGVSHTSMESNTMGQLAAICEVAGY